MFERRQTVAGGGTSGSLKINNEDIINKTIHVYIFNIPTANSAQGSGATFDVKVNIVIPTVISTIDDMEYEKF
jgi:hypothetical protein